jgi:hypothetical protein
VNPSEFWDLDFRTLEYIRRHRETEIKRQNDLAKLTGYLAGVAFASAWGGNLGQLHKSLFPDPSYVPLPKTEPELKDAGYPGPWDGPGWRDEPRDTSESEQ